MTHEEVLDEVNVIYERISQHSKDYDSAWSDGNYTEALEILIDYYEVGFIEELEKIKQEIQSIIALADSRGEGTKLAYQCQIVINERISELKGENNPDCRNCDKWKTCENGEKGHENGTSIGYSIGECGDYVELKGE